jgi:hypothetical protein
MNPTAPKLHATIKLHKDNIPIRPPIKLVTKILYNHLHVLNIYTIQNSKHLTTDLESIEINENIRMCSFDIKNMYTNMLKADVLNIIENGPEAINQKEMLNILRIISDQN